MGVKSLSYAPSPQIPIQCITRHEAADEHALNTYERRESTHGKGEGQ